VRRRRVPRTAATAVGALADRLRPVTGLAAVQAVWTDAVGPAIAQEATPVSERGGVVTVACTSSVWAQEIELMAPTLCAALNARLGPERVTGLRCTGNRAARAPGRRTF
jgi:predicted nucleic acid-binding Zn ribbon protein